MNILNLANWAAGQIQEDIQALRSILKNDEWIIIPRYDYEYPVFSAFLSGSPKGTRKIFFKVSPSGRVMAIDYGEYTKVDAYLLGKCISELRFDERYIFGTAIDELVL